MTTTERLKLDNLPRWVHVVGIGSFALITLSWVFAFIVYRDVNIWASLDEGKLRGGSYTERVYANSIFRTRANTWSNLAYVFVGTYAIALGIYDYRKRWTMQRGYLQHVPAYSIAFGLACIYLGYGSGIFHASLTRWGQQLDVAGMYPPMMVLIAVHAGRWLSTAPGTRLPLWPLYLLIVAAISAYLYVYKWEMSSSRVLSTIILTHATFAVVDNFRKQSCTQSRWMILAFLTLVVAIFFRQIDVNGKFTGPDSWLQGHLIWHILTAVSQGLLYIYFRSEEREG